jgi:3-hydroxybutyrate dehydrogenase
VDVSQRRLDAFAKETAAAHDVEVLPLQCNVADEDAVARTVSETVATFGRIDYAVNGAGLAHVAKFAEFKTTDVSRMAELVLTAVGQSDWNQRARAVLLHA